MREGMARVVPVPLLSLFTGYELETMVSLCSKCLWDLLFSDVYGNSLSGVWKSRHPAASTQVGGHIQRGGANSAAHTVVLGGDGVLLQHGEVSLSEVCLGSHPAAAHHR